MVRLLALCVLTGVCPAQDAGPVAAPASMGADTALRRVAGASAGASAENLAVLEEVAERSEDAGLAALAAYNAGTMARELGDDRAAALLRRADALATDPALRAAARYNLGHALLPPEEAADSIEAIDARTAALAEAERAFRSALEVDPGHRDAARNTELVRRQIRDLRRQRDEMEARQRAEREFADQLRELAEQQAQEAEASEGRAGSGEGQAGEGESGEAAPDASDQDGGDGAEQPAAASDPPQADEDATRRQRELNERTERAAESARQAGAGESASEAVDRARQAQRRAQEALENGDDDAAAEHQREAAAALREAAERAGPGDEPGNQPGEETGESSEGEGAAPGETPDAGDGAAQEDAQGDPAGEPGADGSGQGAIDPLAEALLDKERRERARRAEYLQRRARPRVERDW